MLRIGIIGYGIVGQALHSCIKSDYEVVILDPLFQYGNSQKDINECDIVFVCVPTPTINGVQDTSILDDISTWINTLVVIKSTVLPNWLKKHPEYVYNPEFLSQNNSVSDFYNQELLILGGQVSQTKRVKAIYENAFKMNLDCRIHICSAVEASQFKYVHNIYHAYKAIFWNYVQSLTDNQRKMWSLYSSMYDRDESSEMSRICSDGLPGVGGKCFPKDLVAMHSENPHLLTDMMIEFNRQLRPDEMRLVL